MNYIRKIKSYISIIKHGPFDTSSEDGRCNERLRRIALTALTALLSKIVAVITPLITVRITISYLGEEIYGLWITVVSFFSMIHYADLGLGSGLQTELSRTSAFDDNVKCKRMISSTYIVLSFVAIFLLLILLIIYPYVNWSSIFNAQSIDAKRLAGPIVLAILIPTLLNIPLAIIQRTQSAMQEAYRTNIWQLCANILSLILVILISIYQGSKIVMILASSSVVVIVALINMIYYFRRQRPELSPGIRYFDRHVAKCILKTGILFCVLSIFTTLSLSIDNWIVAQTGTLSNVTSYSIMLKSANLINVVSIMISSPLWAANGEALARGDYDWVRRNTINMSRLSLALAIFLSIILLLFAKPVLMFLSKNLVSPDYMMLIGMCVTNLLVSYTNPYFMVLNGGRIIIFQIVIYAIFSIISLPLKFFIGSSLGIQYIPWIAALMYLMVLTIPTEIRAKKILRKK